MTGTTTPPSVRRELLDSIRAQLKAENANAAVVVDHQLKIIDVSEQAPRFLQLRSGELSAHLLNLVRPELRLSLRAAIAHVEQTGQTVQARRVRVQRDDQTLTLRMTVRPVHEPPHVRHGHEARGWLIVLFEEALAGPDDDDDASSAADSAV
ncbi:MAG TPA: PAS domain-containing protein, partial [Variovorax sp.]|nr:PAS domain-containing protein [Variovorax sp.]